MRDRKKIKRKTKIGIAATCIILVITILLSFQIKEIKVTGNKKYTSEEIVNMLLKGNWDRNTIFSIYKNRFWEHEQIPFVEDYKIVFHSPFQAEVIVYEKTVVGYISYMGSYMYFDKDGIIVESSSRELPGIPRIVGLDFGHIALHQPLPVEDNRIFDDILTLTQLLSTYKISVDQIRYDSRGETTLIMGDVRVFLGSNSHISGKISELNDQISVLTGLKGTLYLDTYDETDRVTSYRFVKDK